MLIDPKQIDLSGYAGIDDFNNHLHDGDILEHDGVDSDGGAYPFTTTGTVTFNQEIVAKDAALTEFASGDETIAHVLNDTINCGELHTITVTDEGGINISWDSGTLWDCVEKNIVTTDASGSTGCTDNSINYLYWDRSGGGTALTLGVTHPDHEDHDILVAIIVCQATDIYEIHSVNILSDREEQTSVAMRDILRVVVIDGLIVSEDTDATNAFDVEISAGTFFHFGTTRHELAAGFNTRTTAMTRWFHSSGAWTNDSNAQIDMTQWDDLTDLTGSITVNRYYKSIFMYSENMIHWIYPQVEYDTVAQAIGAPLPTIPVTGEFFPRSVAVIMRGNATAFPTAGSTQWIDIRPLFGTSITGIVTDHGNLAGLSDDDHTHYSLVDGTRPFTGTISGILPTEDDHLATKEYVDDHVTVLANPSATIGLTTVNGSATTAIRSDGAPALSQAIAPTWTNDHIWGTDKKVTFRDSALYINSIADGYMDFTADTAFRFNTGKLGIGVTPTNFVDIEKNDGVAGTVCQIKNNTGGTGAYASLIVASNSGRGEVNAYDDAYTGNLEYAGKLLLYTASPALMLNAAAAAGVIEFYTGGSAGANKFGTINSNGLIPYNNATIHAIAQNGAPTSTTDGALWLDLDASANGDLMCYEGGSWRKIVSLP